MDENGTNRIELETVMNFPSEIYLSGSNIYFLA